LNTAAKKISENDFPALHGSASRASVSAQAEFVFLVRLALGLLIIGTVPNVFRDISPDLRDVLLWGTAIALLFSVIVFVAIRLRKREKIWFAARALAESTKTMSWRYMMVADPYGHGDQNAVDQKLRSDLVRLIETEKEVFGSMEAATAGASQITVKMKAIRSSDYRVRLSTYIDSRIRDQQSWYSTKAKLNRKLSNIFFWVILGSQFAAVIAAFVQAAKPTSPVYLSGLLAAIATALVAWTQMRRHEDLSKSYSLATHELAGILSQSEHISSDKALADFVGDAENAVSREHTLWVARRDTR